jgi:hypothetical protein
MLVNTIRELAIDPQWKKQLHNNVAYFWTQADLSSGMPLKRYFGIYGN